MNRAECECKNCGHTYTILFDNLDLKSQLVCPLCGYNEIKVNWIMGSDS